MSKLAGYKTYIAAAGLLAFAWIGYALGQHDINKAIEMTLEAAAIAGLRNAVPPKDT
jgi:hypothetical protein